jgi:hypothetical protein
VKGSQAAVWLSVASLIILVVLGVGLEALETPGREKIGEKR